MQIRTKLQHMWATAVETMGTFLGQALKSRQGDQEWLDFFALISSAFAHMESCTLVPRFEHLSKDNTFVAVANAEKHLHALNIMSGLSVAAKAISMDKASRKGYSYHLIILDSLERRVRIMAYDRDSFEHAIADYGKAEANAANGEKIEPVLVSAGPIDTLRRAYPNFFLDIRDFLKQVRLIISATKS